MALDGSVSNFSWNSGAVFQNVDTGDDYAIHARIKYPESYAGGGGYQTVLSDGSVEIEARFASGNAWGVYVGGDRVLQIEGQNANDVQTLKRWHSVWWVRRGGEYFMLFDGRRASMSAAVGSHSFGATITLGSWAVGSQNLKAIYEHVAFYRHLIPSQEVIRRVLRGMSPIDAWPGVVPRIYLSGDRRMPEIPVSGWTLSGDPQFAPGFNADRGLVFAEREMDFPYSVAAAAAVSVGGRALLVGAPRRRWSL